MQVKKFTVRGIQLLAIVAAIAISTTPLVAGRFRSAVGGVAIDARGVLSEPTEQANQLLVNRMKEMVQPAEGAMAESSELRRVSLKHLLKMVAQAAASETELSDDVRYLAGLQRVKNVLVYPDQQDIVLVGPGEGWMVTDQGDVVGRTTGLPVIQLDDLLVALRTSQQARQVGISCSIDPTPEGISNMNKLMRKQRSFQPRVLKQIEQAMGPQQISVTGVPDDTHFARVLVAADYRMKRIAMNLEQSPLRQLPSFLDMWRNTDAKVTSTMPRWWLACDYEPMAQTEDGLGWELRGPGVKVMTESEFVAADGKRTRTGKSAKIAQKWASTMTAHYDDLAKRSPVFGQLRNLMDLCVIAAVIDKNNLDEKAGLDLSGLSADNLPFQSFDAPRTVSTKCSFTKRGRDYLITASGGVQIESWQVADKSQVDARVTEVYEKAADAGSSWWK